MKTKGIGSEILDVSGRTIVAYVSKFGNIDLDGDMMMQGCYKASIKARGKDGTNELFHLSNHRPSPEFVLSKPNFEEDSFGLKMTSTIVDTNHGNDIIKLYESGLISQHSVMFSVPKGKWEMKELEDGTNYTTIYEAKLYEGSTVVWGANPETPTLEMKSLYKDMYNNDIQGALDHFGKITKALKKGTFTDEMFALIEIQYKMLESFIIEEIETIKNTLPTNVVEPLDVEKSKNEQLINFLKDLKNNL